MLQEKIPVGIWMYLDSGNSVHLTTRLGSLPKDSTKPSRVGFARRPCLNQQSAASEGSVPISESAMVNARKTNYVPADADHEHDREQGLETTPLSAGRYADLRAWYVAYPLSLRHLEEMMAERGISVNHSTVHHWAIKLLPVLDKAFRQRKRAVGKSRRMDETYIKVKGARKYWYRAVDKTGKTGDFLLCAKREKVVSRRYFEKAIDQNGILETVTIDKSRANFAGLTSVTAEREIPIKIRQERYLNNMVEQGSSADQADRPTDVGIQGFPLRSNHSMWHRAHQHDSERPDEGRRFSGAISPRTSLRSRDVNSPLHFTRCRPRVLIAIKPVKLSLKDNAVPAVWNAVLSV